jgi:hypothetical protein
LKEVLEAFPKLRWAKGARDIDEAIQEMKHGKYVTLEELKGA